MFQPRRVWKEFTAEENVRINGRSTIRLVKVERRVYSELDTADWWWEKQQLLPAGATIIPLLISTDKTVITQHHGDKSAWPVYLAIGNLPRSVRRAQNRPGCLLVGFIPVPTDDAASKLKAELWHTAMEAIFKRTLLSHILMKPLTSLGV